MNDFPKLLQIAFFFCCFPISTSTYQQPAPSLVELTPPLDLALVIEGQSSTVRIKRPQAAMFRSLNALAPYFVPPAPPRTACDYSLLPIDACRSLQACLLFICSSLPYSPFASRSRHGQPQGTSQFRVVLCTGESCEGASLKIIIIQPLLLKVLNYKFIMYTHHKNRRLRSHAH